jgi:hypothetical protein
MKGVLDFLVGPIKQKLDGLQAQAQDEVGTFLKQKRRIMDLPEGVQKDQLSAKQTELEKRATATMAKASDLKEKIEAASSKGLAGAGMAGGLATQGAEVVRELGTLRTDIQWHVGEVDQATGEHQADAPAKEVKRTDWTKWGVVALGAYLLLRGRR